jgi:hypothetical protein
MKRDSVSFDDAERQQGYKRGRHVYVGREAVAASSIAAGVGRPSRLLPAAEVGVEERHDAPLRVTDDEHDAVGCRAV